MSMSYSSRNLEGREKSLQRFFEIVPGFISWSILLGLTALASLRPTWAIVCILAFDLYWLFFLLYTMILLLASHFLLSAERQTDWLTRAQELPDRLKQLHPSADILREGTFRSWISKRVHEQKVRALIESEAPVPAFDAIHQVIIIPILTAGADILIRAIKSLLEQDFPARRMIVILALDERAASRVKETAWELHREHYDRFLGFYLSPLPADAEEESSGKGANITYAAKMAAQVLEQKNIPEKNVIVTCLDAESILHPHYLACLAYHFMISPKRERAGFQPIPVYHSSAWDAPPVSCMLEIASSLFSLVEATDPVKLISLSSHSMSFSALRATDFWPGDMTSGDSSIFWKAFLHFQGDYRVVPMYITLSLDVVCSKTLWSTVKNIYRQKRQWAWGIENFPIVMRGFLQSSEISLRDRFTHGFRMLHRHVAWSTWPFLLLLIGWLPGLIAAGGSQTSIAYYMAPKVQSSIFALASLGLLMTVVLSVLHLPGPPSRYSPLRWMRHIASWLWIPIASIILGALPALDAQTRLMPGKNLTSRAGADRRLQK